MENNDVIGVTPKKGRPKGAKNRPKERPTLAPLPQRGRGRPKGAPNKKKILLPAKDLDKITAQELLQDPANQPLECMLMIMKHYHKQFIKFKEIGDEKRTDEAAKSLFYVAKETAPYCHARVTADKDVQKIQTLTLNF